MGCKESCLNSYSNIYCSANTCSATPHNSQQPQHTTPLQTTKEKHQTSTTKTHTMPA